MPDSAPAQPALESLPGTSVASVRVATVEAADALSFEALLRRHQAMVFSIARHYVFDEARAEDIAQDVFLQLHAELPRLQSEAHVVAWLRRVTAHRSIDALRSPAMARATTLDAMGDPVAPVAEQDFLLADHLRRLVASLPDQQRIAVILRYQEDLSPGEIAETLEMPVATVKSHLRRALDSLRQKASRLASPAARLTGGDRKDHHV
jgi:RNA polymerase sigma-70 factor (ECF subfamily)